MKLSRLVGVLTRLLESNPELADKEVVFIKESALAPQINEVKSVAHATVNDKKRVILTDMTVERLRSQ